MTTLYVLPTADTHCFDEDTKTDCWSFSRDLLVQEIAKAEQRGREAMRQECAEFVVRNTGVVPVSSWERLIKELK